MKLFDENVVPVCAPSFLASHRVGRLDDLKNYVLLQCTSRPEAWHEWFVSQGVTAGNSYHGPQFDTFDLCIRAALVGFGFALVPEFMVRHELNNGDLVIAWKHYSKSKGSYYMAYSEHSHDIPKIKFFVEWVEAKVAGG